MGAITNFFDNVKEKAPEFWDTCLAYMKAHPKLTLILFACLALLVCVIIVLIVVGAVAGSKKKKRRAAEKAALEAAATADAAETEKTVDETVEEAVKEEPIEETVEEAVKEEPVEETQEPIAEAPVEEVKEAPAPVEEKAEEKPAPVAKKPAAKKETKPAEKKETKPAEKKETKPAAKKETAAKTVPKTAKAATDKGTKYTGKWVILRMVTDQEGEEETYFFELHASNGEKLLSSEEYTSYAGAVKGIATHKSNIEKGNFRITLSKKGDYIFKLLSGKNTLLCTGENYPTKARCESAIESTKRFAQSAVLDENVQELHVKVPAEDDSAIAPLPENCTGKWIIEKQNGIDGEPVYYFALYANNGEKLLSSEEYTTYEGAVNGVATHKKNIESGNFRITLTKRGDYIYKLLNGNGQLLCLGEHYKTRRLCQNAVDSVKRFAANSPMLTDAANK